MAVFPVIFEDQSAANFRPLSWSRPVYELRCGIFNLRERVARINARVGQASPERATTDIGLLPRMILKDFEGPAGAHVGTDQVLPEVGDAMLLMLAARLGQDWDLLRILFRLAADGRSFAWRDEHGLLACVCPPDMARPLVESWEAWNWQTDTSGCWRRADEDVAAWTASDWTEGWEEVSAVTGTHLLAPVTDQLPPAVLAARLAEGISGDVAPAFSYIWDLVPAVGSAIVADVDEVVARGETVRREPFGIVADDAFWGGSPPWAGESAFQHASNLGEAALATGAVIAKAERVWLAQGSHIAPGAVLDAAAGPVVIDRDVTIMPHAYIAGPVYVGPGTTIKASATIYGETSIGAVCRIAGEVAESTFLDFGNKQHDGFIGHAYLGSWINLGAGTTCSDLKNNYGPIRVDLGTGTIDTGQRFLGLLMGEHAKSAIGTRFNTGTSIGFASNVFATGFPAKYLPNFSWGGGMGNAMADTTADTTVDATEIYDVARAVATAELVCGRRGVRFDAAHQRLFRALARQSD